MKSWLLLLLLLASPTLAQGVDERVRFAPGASYGTAENAVVRGDRDVYRLGASKGQRMTVVIISLEDNAVFDVVAPNGKTLATEQRAWTTALPAAGDYRVVVGGTRGNATYRVLFHIE